MTETLQPAICGEVLTTTFGDRHVCTREPGHTGPHDDANLGMAPWHIRVWDQT